MWYGQGSCTGVLPWCTAWFQMSRVILCLFSLPPPNSDWIVVAEFSPNLPSPSWHGKYEVSIFVSTVLSVWPCLGVANLNIIMDNFCIWFDWLAAPPWVHSFNSHNIQILLITEIKNSKSPTTYSIIFFLSLTFLSCCLTHSKRIDLKGPQLHLKIINF